jgi:RHS repeat-associated protein
MKGVAPDVPYTITNNGGTNTLIVDQTQNNNTWIELGVFSFAAETITVSMQNTPNGKATVDAVYVVDTTLAESHRATWKLDPPESGDYEVYVRWPADIPGAARKVEFTVDHDGGSDAFVVNQRIDGNQWYLLGIFSFTIGTGDVTLGDKGRRRHVLADAVRIVKSEPKSGLTRIFYYHNDHLGTPNRMTDEGRTVVWSAGYEPFGQATLVVMTAQSNLRFPGQFFDPETGLHYNYFRDFDPQSGRYIASDPIGILGGEGLYTYAYGNPIRVVDTYGLVGALGVGPGQGVPEPIEVGECLSDFEIEILANGLLGSIVGCIGGVVGCAGGAMAGVGIGAIVGGKEVTIAESAYVNALADSTTSRSGASISEWILRWRDRRTSEGRRIGKPSLGNRRRRISLGT